MRTHTADSGQLFSLTDIARHFSLPESTARYYCKRFAAFLPHSGEGRRRRYRQDSLAVIAAILEHMRTQRTAAGVEEALRRQFPCQLDAIVPVRQEAARITPMGLHAGGQDALPALALQLLEQQTRAMEGIANSLHLLTQRQEDLQSLVEQARLASEENQRLRQEMETLRLLQHNAEKVQQEDLNQIRTWVTRMAKRSTPDSPVTN